MVVSESKLLELDLTHYDCIFLCNIGQLDSNEARALHDYLQQGGGLVTILGDQVIAARYNRELYDSGEAANEDPVSVLPARIGTAFYDGEYHFIDPLNYQHPMLAQWKGNPKSGLGTVPVVKYMRLELTEETPAEIVMALDTGDPLIVAAQIGRGRSLLVATDLSTISVVDAEIRRPWSLVASWLNSQPFFEGLWKTAIGGKISQRNVEVGESFGARHYRSDGHATMRVELPEDPPRRLPVASTLDAAQWSFSDTEISGIYRAAAGNGAEEIHEGNRQETAPVGGEMLFAVNVNAQESDLEKLRPEDLPDGFNFQGEWRDADSSQLVPSVQRNSGLHQLLLCTVLVLLFTETFLAWWIGHRSA